MRLNRASIILLFIIMTASTVVAAEWFSPFGSAEVVTAGDIFDMRDVSVAVDSLGQRHVAYVFRDGNQPTDLDHIVYVSPDSVLTELASGTSLGSFAGIAVRPDRTVLVVYHELVDSQHTVRMRALPEGGIWSAPITVASTDSILRTIYGPCLEIDDDGAWHLAYGVHDLIAGHYEIHYRPEFGPDMTVGGDADRGLDLAVAPGGIVHVVAAQSTAMQDSSRIQIRTSQAGVWDSWRTIVDVENVALGLYDPEIVAEPSGRWKLFYVDTFIDDVVLGGALMLRGPDIGPSTIAGLDDHMGLYAGGHRAPDGTLHTAFTLTSVPEGARQTRRVTHLSSCATGDKLVPFSFPSDGCGEDSPENLQALEDSRGNKFVHSCVNELYFCVRYVPASGPQRMISKCPWYVGINTWKYYVAIDGAGNQSLYSGSHISRDFWCDDPNDYCDDFPPGGTDHRFDWVTQEFDVCSELLTVRHVSAAQWPCPTLAAGGAVVTHGSYSGPAPISGCDYAQFPPTDVNHACANRTNGGMRVSEARIRLAGSPSGGLVAVGILDLEVAVQAVPAQPLDDLAAALAAGVNDSVELAERGLIARSEGNELIVLGIGPEDVSLTSLDPGLDVPSAPTSFSVAVRDTLTEIHERHLDLSWTNADDYDIVYVTKHHRLEAVLTPPIAQSLIDADPWSWPQEYRVVGWRDGSPSAPATTGLLVAVVDQDSGQERPGEVPSVAEARAFPNPFNARVTLSYRLRTATNVAVEVFDARGRKVAIIASRRPRSSGWHEVSWDGRDRGGRLLASGVYFVRVATDGLDSWLKIALLK